MNLDLSAQRLLILAPHPDDEVIGCGGLISRVKDAGGEVFVQFITVGDTADASAAGFSSGRERMEEIERVAEVLGYDGWELVFPGDRHLRLDVVPQGELIEAIERSGTCSIGALRPTIVTFPDPCSYNQDHRAVAVAAVSALRPGDRDLRHQPSALVYEQVADGWTVETTGPPTVYVALDQQHLDAKLEAMDAYASQVREHPSTRSTEALAALARCRGAQAGTPLAEAFRGVRWVL